MSRYTPSAEITEIKMEELEDLRRDMEKKELLEELEEREEDKDTLTKGQLNQDIVGNWEAAGWEDPIEGMIGGLGRMPRAIERSEIEELADIIRGCISRDTEEGQLACITLDAEEGGYPRRADRFNDAAKEVFKKARAGHKEDWAVGRV